jgi:flagellar biosynthesis protein FlhG
MRMDRHFSTAMPDLSPQDVRPGQAVRAVSPAARTAGPTIWAVASGKGGVGKSVVSASLAIGLASTGPRAVAVDLDLGGANLHSLFGCERARHTLADFVRGRIDSLADALSVTTVPGVRLLSGARAGFDLAGARRAQKQRILAGLASIDAGHVVLDLGAGSGAHTLDAFLAAHRRLLVVTPEPTAIENAYHFLNAAFFRALRHEARGSGTSDALAAVLEDARERGATPRELVSAASRADARTGDRLRARLRSFEVDLVVNRCEAENAREHGEPIAAAGRAQLGAGLRFAGALAEDRSVTAAVVRGVPVMQLFPGSRFASDIYALVASLFASDPASATRAFALAALPTARASRECRAPIAAPPAPGRRALPGRSLRERREQLGLELAALHERTRIRYRHLESIEAERFDALPADVIVREYVRQIAAALDLSDPAGHARIFIEKARASRAAAEAVGEVAPVPRASVRPRRVAVVEVLPAEADPDRDLPMPMPAHREAATAPASRSAVATAFARALSRAGARTAPREFPSAEALLADFDYEPEI